MVPMAFVTLVTPVSAKIAVAPLPDGTVAGLQLDDMVKELVAPTQVWAATPAGDGQVAASKAAPQCSMDTARIGGPLWPAAARNDGLLISWRCSPPHALQELGRVLITPN